MRILQVTMGAGARTQVTTAQIYTPYLSIQLNAGSARVGDNTVTTTKGTVLSSTPFIVQRSDNRIALSSYFIAAPVGTVVDILYE